MLARDRGQPLPLDRLPGAGLAGRLDGPARGRALRRGRAAIGDRLEPDRRRALGDDDVHAVRPARTRRPGRATPASATPTPASSTWPATRPTSRTRSSSARCWRRPTSSGSSGCRAATIFQGEQGLDQMAFMRPSPDLSHYATPVHGLYLCGAGTHPGGGVMAAAGHNAARRILRDRRVGRLRGQLRRRAGRRAVVPAVVPN